MKNTFRIIFFAALLLGGAYAFNKWVAHEVTTAFAPLDAAYQQALVYNTGGVDIQGTSTEVFSTTSITASLEVPVVESDIGQFAFTFPTRAALLYQGCTYPVTWTASSTVRSASFVLVDAGTRRVVDAQVSNLKDFQRDAVDALLWRVGVRIWPGEYFLELTSANGLEKQEKGYRFSVASMDTELSQKDKQALCEQTGGTF